MAKQIKALELNLSAEEEAAAERIYQALKDKTDQQLRNMARKLAATSVSKSWTARAKHSR